MSLKNKCFFSAVIVVACLTLLPRIAFGMTVSPAFLQFTISEKNQEQVVPLSVKNDTGVRVEYDVRIVDVDTDTGSLLPMDTVSPKTVSVFSVDKPTFMLDPGQSVNIFVIAKNNTDLAPGGHYGALLVKQKSASANEQVPLNQIVSVGIFLVKEDGAVKDITLVSELANGIYFNMPKQTNIVLKNNGNVDVAPRGFVAISRGTQLVVKKAYNETSKPVFAGKEQLYTISTLTQKLHIPGKYTMTVSYRSDAAGMQKIATSTFWYIPLWSIMSVVLFVGTVTFYFYKKHRGKKTLNCKNAGDNVMVETFVKGVDAPNSSTEKHTRITVNDMVKEAVRTHSPKRPAKKRTKKLKKKVNAVKKTKLEN